MSASARTMPTPHPYTMGSPKVILGASAAGGAAWLVWLIAGRPHVPGVFAVWLIVTALIGAAAAWRQPSGDRRWAFDQVLGPCFGFITTLALLAAVVGVATGSGTGPSSLVILGLSWLFFTGGALGVARMSAPERVLSREQFSQLGNAPSRYSPLPAEATMIDGQTIRVTILRGGVVRSRPSIRTADIVTLRLL